MRVSRQLTKRRRIHQGKVSVHQFPKCILVTFLGILPQEQNIFRHQAVRFLIGNRRLENPTIVCAMQLPEACKAQSRTNGQPCVNFQGHDLSLLLQADVVAAKKQIQSAGADYD